mgnify:CR=1 FL=1
MKFERINTSFEVISEHLPAVLKCFLDQTLAVEVEEVEGKDADLHLDLLLHSIFPLPGGKYLEGLDAFLLAIPSNSFAIEHCRLYSLRQAALQPGDDVRELGGVVLLVPTEDVHPSILVQVDLSALTIVLPLAGEPAVFEPSEHLLDTLGWVRQHWLQL